MLVVAELGIFMHVCLGQFLALNIEFVFSSILKIENKKEEN